VTDVEEEPAVKPSDFKLYQNYPNPFNPATTIKFKMPRAAKVTLQIFDSNGKRIRTLLTGNLPSGEHNITWDGTNDSGQRVSSGMYFYKLLSGRFISVKRMLLVK
jgi:hypothetical protein